MWFWIYSVRISTVIETYSLSTRDYRNSLTNASTMEAFKEYYNELDYVMPPASRIQFHFIENTHPTHLKNSNVGKAV